MKNINEVEIINLQLLLGGVPYTQSLKNNPDISHGDLFEINKDENLYKKSLAYLKDASSSISRSSFEKVNSKHGTSCPSVWRCLNPFDSCESAGCLQKW